MSPAIDEVASFILVQCTYLRRNNYDSSDLLGGGVLSETKCDGINSSYYIVKWCSGSLVCQNYHDTGHTLYVSFKGLI